jgi:hypothetical protein
MPLMTTPSGVMLLIEWEGENNEWHASRADAIGIVGAPDRFLEGMLMDLLGYEVAHDEPPEWLPAFVEHVRASARR